MSAIPEPPAAATDAAVATHIALIYQRLDQLVRETSDRGKDHEDRLRKLEQFKWILVGLAAAAGGAAGGLANLIGR